MRPLILWPSMMVHMLQIRSGDLQSVHIPVSTQGVLMFMRVALTGAE
jgi:hypothetical protein